MQQQVFIAERVVKPRDDEYIATVTNAAAERLYAQRELVTERLSNQPVLEGAFHNKVKSGSNTDVHWENNLMRVTLVREDDHYKLEIVLRKDSEASFVTQVRAVKRVFLDIVNPTGGRRKSKKVSRRRRSTRRT